MGEEKKYLKEVEKALEPFGKKAPVGIDVYKTAHETWFISVPKQRSLVKKGFSFSNLSHSKQKKIWKFIWDHSNVMEVKQCALFYLQNRREDPAIVKDFSLFKYMVSNGLDNWAHSDILSDLISRVVERDKKLALPILQKWNTDKNPWKRRQSVVSLFYYQSLRKTYPPKKEVFQLLKNLLNDEHYYVQKGVGWTLREAWQVYEKETRLFLEKNLSSISATAFGAAVEKCPKNYKEKLKAKRKLERKKRPR